MTSGCGLGRRETRTLPPIPVGLSLRLQAAPEARRRRHGRSANADPPAAPRGRRAGRQSPSSRPPARPRRCGSGSAGSEPSRAGRRSGGAGKRGEVEAVIDERHPVRLRSERAADGARLARVQVTPHSASASFSRFSQSGVVQMSLAWAEKVQERPVRSGGVAHDGGRRVQIMDVQMCRRRRRARGP